MWCDARPPWGSRSGIVLEESSDSSCADEPLRDMYRHGSGAGMVVATLIFLSIPPLELSESGVYAMCGQFRLYRRFGEEHVHLPAVAFLCRIVPTLPSPTSDHASSPSYPNSAGKLMSSISKTLDLPRNSYRMDQGLHVSGGFFSNLGPCIVSILPQHGGQNKCPHYIVFLLCSTIVMLGTRASRMKSCHMIPASKRAVLHRRKWGRGAAQLESSHD